MRRCGPPPHATSCCPRWSTSRRLRAWRPTAPAGAKRPSRSGSDLPVGAGTTTSASRGATCPTAPPSTSRKGATCRMEPPLPTTGAPRSTRASACAGTSGACSVHSSSLTAPAAAPQQFSRDGPGLPRRRRAAAAGQLGQLPESHHGMCVPLPPRRRARPTAQGASAAPCRGLRPHLYGGAHVRTHAGTNRPRYRCVDRAGSLAEFAHRAVAQNRSSPSSRSSFWRCARRALARPDS